MSVNEATMTRVGPAAAAKRSVHEIQSWLVSYLANLLDVPAERINVSTSFERFGLDSAATVALTGDLAAWLKRKLDPNLAGEFPTIEAIAAHLAEGEATRA